MKTPEDIKKGLECCDQQKCGECLYDSCGDDYRICVPELIADLRILLEQMEAEAVKKAQRIGELETEKDQLLDLRKQLEREKDAVLNHPSIRNCDHLIQLRPENTEVQDG